MQGNQGFQIFNHPYSTGGAIINLSNSYVTMTSNDTTQKYTFKNTHSWAAAYMYLISLNL